MKTNLKIKKKDISKDVYGYCRVSTSGQAIEGESLDVQKERIENFCRSKGLNLINVYREEGVSGAVHPRNRPQMSQLLDRLDQKEVGGFVVTKIDRLSRSTKDFVNFMADSRDQFDCYIIANDIDTSTPQGKFTLVLFSAVAELERDLTSERVKEIIQSKKARGERWGTIPFGKRLIEGTNLLEDHPDEQRTINMTKEYRKSYIEIDGKKKYMTLKEIASKLKDNGCKNKDGEVRWFPAQIRRMLNDGEYTAKGQKK